MNTNTLTRLLGAFVLGSLLVAGCGGNNGNGNNGNGNNGGGGTADTTHGAPAGSGAPAAQEPSSSAEVKSYLFHGTPTAIDSAAGTITVRHEKVEGLAGEGTDTWPVADPAILKDAAVGKETHLTLRSAGGSTLVTKIQAGHEKGEEH